MKNPIIPGFTGDPCVLKEGDDYYLVPTCEDYKWDGHTFNCYHSKDLQNWSEPKTILNISNLSWAKKMAWAPTMAKVNGYYYLCFCAEQQIGIAVCETPMGEFRDILDAPLIKHEQYGFQSIDPCLFVDDNQKVYLVWGQGKCYIAEVELTPVSARFIGEPVNLSDEFYWQNSLNPKCFDITVFNEAPDLIKYRGKYLLSWSVYDTRDFRYRIRYAWADNVFGPYIQPIDDIHDNILIKGEGDIQCTGHAAITIYEDELYLVYHRFVIPRVGYHRETCCDIIIFIDDTHLKVFPTG